jgi:hypothetical protein
MHQKLERKELNFNTVTSSPFLHRSGKPSTSKKEVLIFWAVSQCTVVVGYQLFRGPYTLSEILVSYSLLSNEYQEFFP